MKKLVFLVLLVATTATYAQEVTVIASTKGIAPVPAFNLPEPSALVFLKTNITKNLEFSPDFTYSLKSGKGWFMDTWVRYNQPLDSAKRFTATAGINWSFFFQPIVVGSEELTQAVRYPTYQVKLKFVQNEKSTYTIDYWYTYPIEKAYGVKGSYLGFIYSRTHEMKNFILASNPQILFISYSDGTKGFSSSADIALGHKKSGLFISSQAMLPLTATNSKFAWNASIGITRKLH